jgi:hypothetical protein
VLCNAGFIAGTMGRNTRQQRDENQYCLNSLFASL